MSGKWRTQGRRETLVICVDEMTCATPLSHAVQCESVTTRTQLTKRITHSHVSVHVRCVEGVQGIGSHVVIGRAVSTQTLHQVQISFLLDFAVHFCTCSQTVFCDRHVLVVANCCTLMHRENGYLRCCVHGRAHNVTLWGFFRFDRARRGRLDMVKRIVRFSLFLQRFRDV